MLNQGTCQTMLEGSSMLLVDHEASLNPYVQQQCPQPSITQWGINYQQLYLQTFWEENGLKPATCINICPKNDKSNENKFNSDHDKKKKTKKKTPSFGHLRENNTACLSLMGISQPPKLQWPSPKLSFPLGSFVGWEIPRLKSRLWPLPAFISTENAILIINKEKPPSLYSIIMVYLYLHNSYRKPYLLYKR